VWRTNRVFSIWFVAALLTCFAGSAAAQTKQQEADQLFQAKQWAQAAQAYEVITRSEPNNAQAWFYLGASLQETDEYSRALHAFEQAEKTGFQPLAAVLFRELRVYGKLQDTAKAVETVDRLLNAGFANVQVLRTHPDLEALRAEPRFAEAIARVEKAAHPCAYQPEYRQFDFWIGEWDVFVTGTQNQSGTSSIQLILDSCIIFENWTGGNGYTGKSFNLYNAVEKKWQQIWVDSRGGIIQFTGEARDGNLYYTADTPQPDGTRLLRRLTFFHQGPDQVRQFSEASTDGGKTWSPEYDLTYVRRKPAS